MVTPANQPTEEQGEYSAICLFAEWKIERRDCLFVQLLRALSFFVESFVIFPLYLFETLLLLRDLFFLFICLRHFYCRGIGRFLLVLFIVERFERFATY